MNSDDTYSPFVRPFGLGLGTAAIWFSVTPWLYPGDFESDQKGNRL